MPWRGVRELTATDYGISTTDVAGPTGGRSGLPVGTFYVGLAGPGGLGEAERIQTGETDRDLNKHRAAQAAIDLLGRHLPHTA
ncbi:MAG: CinA family protein [SAR202 cluster bacterium]|nr:CinA family protein [SAR202 cluster bacterium]